MKRYQIFVSSTYKDLKIERETVMKTLLENDVFPAGMELFPASSEEQMEYIKKVIEDSDYYLLIVAGMYGSTNSNGISFTQLEYEVAKQLNKPILAFLSENIEILPANKVEKTEKKRKQLNDFLEDVKTNRVVQFWKSKDELASKVSSSIQRAIRITPSVGWMRANEVLGFGQNHFLCDFPKSFHEDFKLFKDMLIVGIDMRGTLTAFYGELELSLSRGACITFCMVKPGHSVVEFFCQYRKEPTDHEYVSALARKSIASIKSLQKQFPNQVELRLIDFPTSIGVISFDFWNKDEAKHWVYRYAYKPDKYEFHKMLVTKSDQEWFNMYDKEIVSILKNSILIN